MRNRRLMMQGMLVLLLGAAWTAVTPAVASARLDDSCNYCEDFCPTSVLAWCRANCDGSVSGTCDEPANGCIDGVTGQPGTTTITCVRIQ